MDGVFEVERTVLPDRLKERYAAIVLGDQIVVDVIALADLAVVDVSDDIHVFGRVQFLAELDLIDLLAFEKLFVRDASEVEHLHEVHHIVGTEHRIRLSHNAFLYERVDDILANLLSFFEHFHTLYFCAKFKIKFDLCKRVPSFFHKKRPHVAAFLYCRTSDNQASMLA